MESFIHRNSEVKSWKVGKDIANRYESALVNRGCNYLGEKTKKTIGQWLKEGDKKATMGIVMVASYAISDYHDYMKKGGLNGMQFAVIKMNEDMDMENILAALEEVLEPIRQ